MSERTERDDPPRLLHRRLGYTDRHEQALPHEPEAVSRKAQSSLTEDAHMREHERVRADWVDVREHLLAGLDHGVKCRFDKKVRDELHDMRRAVKRIDERFEQRR